MDDLVLGNRELDVMRVLWDLGSGTVTDVRERLPVDLAYTTVLTILRNLEEKAYVSRVAEGRAHRYSPRVGRLAARRSAIARVVDTLFHGAPEELIAHMVEDRTLTARDVRRLRALIASPDRSGRKR
ncbi:MAG TPA: BlaI family transcriptional regulator [Gemmatimonadetes bacterium]|jgi:predicted transcriptional regulator|nr:BlaI family transcriptional regulator [Gemmatimonadota bacterium]